MEDQAIEKRRRNYIALPTKDLMASNEPEAIAELQWRLAIPLSIPILAMIAVPLSAVNPRQGRFGKIVPGLGIFFVYYIFQKIILNIAPLLLLYYYYHIFHLYYIILKIT